VTSAELIEELQKLDPDGTTEVTIHSQPIWYIDRLPAYYDGRLLLLHRDHMYQIISAEYTGKGAKIVLGQFDLKDFLEDFPEFTVHSDTQWYLDRVEKWREAGRKLLAQENDDIRQRIENLTRDVKVDPYDTPIEGEVDLG
jgi:hypothetical protein